MLDLSAISIGDMLQIGSLIGAIAYFKARIETKIEAILEQTTKTNGRVNKAEDNIDGLSNRVVALETINEMGHRK